MANLSIAHGEVRLEKNPYREINIKSVTTRSHEYSSQGWDAIRIIEAQGPGGGITQVVVMSPAACIVLMAGIPPTMPNGRYPFAWGPVWGTPRNLFLLSEATKAVGKNAAEFEFLRPEDQDRFDAESKKFEKEIRELEASLYPERAIKSAKAPAKAVAPKIED